jgi:uncharacterized RDD family membrane protein YckC/cytoskeletal protein CcmA (bactofilin family)
MKLRFFPPFLGAAAACLLAFAPPAPTRAQAFLTTVSKTDPSPEAAPGDDDSSRDAPHPVQHKQTVDLDLHDLDKGDERVTLFNNLHIKDGERIDGQAVVLFGNLTVDGEVGNQAVVVMGNATINGVVHGQVVDVLGDVTLGPKAHVDGQVVCTGGRVEQAPGSFVGGQIVEQSIGSGRHHFGALFSPWIYNCLRWGRPLGFGVHLAWIWLWTLGLLGLYALLALIFPEGIRRCGDTLALRPGITILCAVLTLLALPLVFILLMVSVIGIPVAFLLPVATFAALAFGKSALYALIGRRLTGGSAAPALAVLLGGCVCLLAYLIPILGLLAWTILTGLGLGCVVATLFTSQRLPQAPASPPSPSPVPTTPAPSIPPAPAAADPVPVVPLAAPTEASAPPPVILPPPAPVPPPLASAALPRAGFWIRFAALLIDLILVGVIVVPTLGMFVPGSMLVLLPAYTVILWKLKGSTVGGIVCRLQLVRVDGRPVDWTTALVRAFAAYLSVLCLGLGFIWVAFDAERQSWHDKIAGTTVVRSPAGISLV